jgi:outer membrane protein insertion porin family
VRSPRRDRALLRAVLLVLALAAGPGVARAQDDDLLGALKRVEAVRVEGNHEISTGTIKKVLRTGGSTFLGLRSPPLFRPDFLRSDVQSIQTLYLRRGFLDAQATAVADSGTKPGRVVVTYTVVEGLQVRVRSIAFDSSAVFTDEERRKPLGLEPGEPYDPVQVALDRGALGALYADRGHFPAIETTVDRDSAWVDIRYVIRDGPAYHLREVTVSGVEQVDTSAVRREVILDRGDLYRRNRVLESSERLSSTGLFTTVEIEPVLVDSLGGIVDLGVRVRERKKRWLEGGVGTGTEDKVRFLGKWGHRNLSGDGNSLTLGTDLGFRYFTGRQIRARYRAELAYVEPWLFKSRTRGRVGAAVERGAEQFAGIEFVQESAQLAFGVSRDFFSSRSRISAVFENTWSRVDRILVPEGAPLDTIFVAPYLPSLTFAFDQDRRDDPLSPSRGTINNLTLQIAGVRENDGRYWKVEGQSAKHAPLSLRRSIGARLRLGLIKPIGSGPDGAEATIDRVPQTDRYRVGGATTIRGYHDNGIDANAAGGALLAVVNVELRSRLFGPVGAQVFVDGGNVWSDPSRFRWSHLFRPSGVDGTTSVDDVRWSYGAGLSLFTPVGPMRLDYARRLYLEESDVVAGRYAERGLQHFSIGFIF